MAKDLVIGIRVSTVELGSLARALRELGFPVTSKAQVVRLALQLAREELESRGVYWELPPHEAARALETSSISQRLISAQVLKALAETEAEDETKFDVSSGVDE